MYELSGSDVSSVGRPLASMMAPLRVERRVRRRRGMCRWRRERETKGGADDGGGSGRVGECVGE